MTSLATVWSEPDIDELFCLSSTTDWIDSSLLASGWGQSPALLAPLLSDRSLLAVESATAAIPFREGAEHFLQAEQILNAQLQTYVLSESHPELQLASYSGSLNRAPAAQMIPQPDKTMPLQRDPWYDISEDLLLQNFPGIPAGSSVLPSTLLTQPGHFGFWGDLPPVSTTENGSRQIAVNPRLSVVGDSSEILMYPTISSLNAQVIRMMDTRSAQQAPRVGVVYEFMPEKLDGYYTFDQSSLLSSLDGGGEGASIFSPFSGESHRAGVQARFLEGRWSVMASGFYSETDIASTFVPSPYFDWSRGAEVAIQARVTKRWRTTLRLSEIESQMSAGEATETWTPPKKQTSSTASIWNRVNLIHDEKQTLAIGLGTRLVNSYKNSYSNSMILPGYSRWDLGLFYRRDGLEARLYVENMLDRGYYENLDWLLNNPDSPLSIEAQLQLRY